jgi:hypothetical protein
MKRLRIALNITASIGLLAAISLADSLYPTTKELMSSIVILIMSVVMIIVAQDIKNITSKKLN